MLNKPYLSFQEMLEKTESQRRAIRDSMDSSATFHPSDASLLDGQKSEDRYLIKETLRNIPLSEFLSRGQTLGDYLVPNKVHDTLVFVSQLTDKVPLISQSVVNGWKGADLLVDIVAGDSLISDVANTSVSGAIQQTDTGATKKATLTPLFFSIAPRITNDLIEDAQMELVEWHIQNAALALGRKSTQLALAVLTTGTDGWGTVNTMVSGAATATTYANILSAYTLNGNDNFISDTLIITPEAWRDTVGQTAVGIPGITTAPISAPGYDMKIQTLDVIFTTEPALHASTDVPGAAFLTCKTIVFDRKNALLTGRKRWMQIERYSDPVKDLAGAVVTCRQDSVTLQNNAIAVITEGT